MNKARWDSLPEDVQKAFRDASDRDWLIEVGKIWRDVDERGIKVAVDSGNTHITLTPEETDAFRVKLEPVVNRWVEEVTPLGIDGAALVQTTRDAIAKNASAAGAQ